MDAPRRHAICSSRMCSMVKEGFLFQLNVIKRNAAEDYVSPEMAPFYNGYVRALPYKDVSRWGSRSKM